MKATYQEIFEHAVRLAGSTQRSPGALHAAVLTAIGVQADAAQLDATWACFYDAAASARIEALEQEVANLRESLRDYESSF